MNYQELVEKIRDAKDLITTEAKTFEEATYKDILRDVCLDYVRAYDEQIEFALKGDVNAQYVLR